MVEAPRVEILGKLGADRIFGFLANPILDPPPTYIAETPPLPAGGCLGDFDGSKASPPTTLVPRAPECWVEA